MTMKIKGVFIVLGLLLIGSIIFGWQYLVKLKNEKYQAPRPLASTTYTFRVGKDAELDGVIGNLEYYGFVKDRQTLLTALEKTNDTTPGNEDSIQIGDKTLDREAEYSLSQAWDAWKIAEVLLNEGSHQDCSHGCPPGLFYPELLPGGEPAPTLSEQYEWVKTFEDCVTAQGQLSSEQYSERTGEPRKCVTPDSREFTEGQEGWTEFRGG